MNRKYLIISCICSQKQYVDFRSILTPGQSQYRKHAGRFTADERPGLRAPRSLGLGRSLAALLPGCIALRRPPHAAQLAACRPPFNALLTTAVPRQARNGA